MRIAVNGFGRMGKLAVRRLFDRGLGANLVLLNDPDATPENAAFTLEFDTVHGHWPRPVAFGDHDVWIDGRSVPIFQSSRIEDLPLAKLAVDLVIDCTGFFKTPESVKPYYAEGVKKVLVSAPIKDEVALNIVYGINHALYDPERHDLVTAASCTTNCLAPVVKVIHSELGIRQGSMTTIHDATNTQVVVDRPHRDLRRGRSALNALIPTTTGSAKAIGLIYPELEGRLNGHAIRVPLLNASLTDCVFDLERHTTEHEVNAFFREYADGALKGILGCEDRPLVSTDYVNDERSSIVDTEYTMVVNGTHLKVYAWYDNEWGYVCRLLDIMEMIMRAERPNP